MGVSKGVTARIYNFRLRNIKYKNGKYSLNLYWYRRCTVAGRDTETYIKKDEEGLMFAACIVCGKRFIQNRLNHVYCSNRCKCNAYQKRRREKRAGVQVRAIEA